MSSWPEDIANMHKKYGFDKMPEAELNKDFLNFRAKFLQEELNEIYSAIDNNDPGEVVDGLIDLCVVAIGTLDLFKVDAQYAWDEVKKANLQKRRGIKPGRKSNGWDLIKDKAWKPPFHGGNLGLLQFTLSGEGSGHVVQTEMFESCEPDPYQEEFEWQAGCKVDSIPETYATKVLKSCIELQKKKGQDYQNANSTVKQAYHYPRGVSTIYDMVHQKMIRMRSLMETAESGSPVPVQNFESIMDSAMDAINYLSFLVSYANGQMDGQNHKERDMFNRKRK